VVASAPRQIPNFFSDKRGEENDKHDEKQPQPHTAAPTMAADDDCDLVFDRDDKTSSKLRIEHAKGDLHNTLRTREEAVACSSAQKRAGDERDESDIKDESDIQREVEELTQDAANAEKSTEVSDVLQELIDKALC
jgi:hypothetical protein